MLLITYEKVWDTIQDHILFRNIKFHWHINVFKSPGVKKPLCFAMLYFQAPFHHVTHFLLPDHLLQ